VLDLMMPVMDGWEVLSWLRENDLRPAVIVVSAATDCNKALDQGATLVMKKPFSNAAFLTACRRVLEK
jgi:DNA-binding response OmpR family regulator